MKKHTLNISTISVLCALCAVAGDAFAAGSVRALGGTGTYNGTSAAATANTGSSAINTARAGSLRISPSTTRTVSAATRTNDAGVATPTQRLSIGKYLGGATSVSTSAPSGSGSSGSGTGPTPAEIADINTNINNLFNTTQAIDNDITNLENALSGKQDKLVPDDDQGIVEIDDENTVSLNMTNLATALWGPYVELRYDGTSHLEWRYANTPGAEWKKLMNLDELTGTYVSTAQLTEAIANLASNDELDNLAAQVALKANASDVYTKDETDTLLNAKANASDVYTKSETYTKDEVDAAIDDITIPEQVQANWNATSGPAQILNKPTLATVATTGSYNDLEDKPTIPGQVNADWDATSGTAEILHKPTLAAVATSGDYDDLTNKPSIPAAQVQSDWNATEGMGVILNKPEIPAAQVSADWNATSGVAQILNKPDLSNYVVNPTLPSEGGDYMLKMNKDGTTYTYSWVEASGVSSGGSGSGSGGSGSGSGANEFDFGDDSGW